jgi:hypothetical protein
VLRSYNFFKLSNLDHLTNQIVPLNSFLKLVFNQFDAVFEEKLGKKSLESLWYSLGMS